MKLIKIKTAAEQDKDATFGPAGPLFQNGVLEVEHSTQAVSSALTSQASSSGESGRGSSAATISPAPADGGLLLATVHLRQPGCREGRGRRGGWRGRSRRIHGRQRWTGCGRGHRQQRDLSGGGVDWGARNVSFSVTWWHFLDSGKTNLLYYYRGSCVGPKNYIIF